MSQSKAIRVLLVDDHPVVRFGLAAIVNGQPDMRVVAEAGSGREAIQLFRQHKPDVTLMDLRLPGLSGVEAIRILLREHPGSRFVVLTTYQGDEEIHRALESGAQAYLLKGMSHQELIRAIRRVHEGMRYLPPLVLETLAERPPHSDLSEREIELLDLIVKGLSNHEIAEALRITEGTVKWHLNILFSRLNVRDRTQAAVAALRRGIVTMENASNTREKQSPPKSAKVR
jgi:two-component system, NarL family, response regulator